MIPAGLSASTTAPAAGASAVTELGGDLGAQELDQLGVGQVAAEAGGAPVPAAAVRAGDRRDVDAPSVERRLTLRAERPPSVLSRIIAATSVPSSARRKSMIPSVSTSPAPVAS